MKIKHKWKNNLLSALVLLMVVTLFVGCAAEGSAGSGKNKDYIKQSEAMKKHYQDAIKIFEEAKSYAKSKDGELSSPAELLNDIKYLGFIEKLESMTEPMQKTYEHWKKAESMAGPGEVDRTVSGMMYVESKDGPSPIIVGLQAAKHFSDSKGFDKFDKHTDEIVIYCNHIIKRIDQAVEHAKNPPKQP